MDARSLANWASSLLKALAFSPTRLMLTLFILSPLAMASTTS